MSDTITGNLPITFNSINDDSEINYRVYGTAEGAGEQTKNLFDKNATNTDNGYIHGAYLNSDGTTGSSTNHIITEYISLPSGATKLGCWTTATNVRGCFYDVNKDIVSSFVTGASGSIPTNAKYVRVTIAITRIDKSMIIADSTIAPTAYIPYGYKIPLTVESEKKTENLWDGTVAEWNHKTLTIVKNPDNSISVSKSTAGGGLYPAIKIGGNLTPGKKYTLSCRITGLTQEMMATHPLVGIRNTSSSAFLSPYMVLTNDGVYKTPIIEIPTGSYAYSLLFVDNNSTITFSNVTISDISINECYTTDYNLYIGSTKLTEEEYADYQEQKVYKRTEQLYNYLDNTANCFLKSDGTLKTDETGYYTSDFIAVEPSTTYTITRTGSVRVKGYDDTKQSIRTDTYNDYSFYASAGNMFTVDSNTHYIRFTLTSAFYDSCTLVPGSTIPSSYIPYLQPTDPSASLPTITTYKGENVLNSTETVGEVTIKYNILKDISQIYTNNQLYDLIDSSLYSLIANPYDSTNPYSTGDYCIYNYQLYKCLFSTQGEWVEEYWESTSLAEIFEQEEEVQVSMEDWEIINSILNKTISGSWTFDFEDIARGRFIGCEQLETISLPNCSVIPNWTFNECTGLTSIDAPKCQNVGHCAFWSCYSLTSCNLPLVTSLGTSAFRECTSLQVASFPLCTVVSSTAFSSCTSLTTVSLPLVNTIYYGAFAGCTSLTEIELPSCLSIYSYGMATIANLQTVSLPKVNRIGSSAFVNCKKLESLYLLGSTRAILSNVNAFGSTPIASEGLLGHYGSIYVPASLVDSYKASTTWATYADRIVAYQE